MGTYIHGLLDNPQILESWLSQIGINNMDISAAGGIQYRDKQYELLADHFEKHIDVDGIVKLAATRR